MTTSRLRLEGTLWKALPFPAPGAAQAGGALGGTEAAHGPRGGSVGGSYGNRQRMGPRGDSVGGISGSRRRSERTGEHPMVNMSDKERYLYLQMLLIGCALEPTTLLLGSACHMSPSSGETALHNHLSACPHLCTTHCIPSVQLSGVAGFLMHKEAAQTSPASVNGHGI